MNIITAIFDGFSRWLYYVAVAIARLTTRLSPPRRLRVIETAAGEFAVEPAKGVAPQTVRIAEDGTIGAPPDLADLVRGSDIAIVLRPDRFLQRPLELPERATEFLGGVVRSQIDRLTPWRADDAVFGWTPPQPAGAGRIVVTVVATARSLVQPYCDAFAGFGARSVHAATTSSDANSSGEAIALVDRGAAAGADVSRLQNALTLLLLAVALTGAVATGVAFYANVRLEARQDELVRQITARRAALREIGAATGGGNTALQLLERRKHDSPARVLVLEALTRALPDNTYVTALQIEGKRVKITGVTTDAPALIKLIEQSDYFSRATFFAPTTRGPSDPGERFHIETQIERVSAGAR